MASVLAISSLCSRCADCLIAVAWIHLQLNEDVVDVYNGTVIAAIALYELLHHRKQLWTSACLETCVGGGENMNNGQSRMHSRAGLIGLGMAMALLTACSSSRNQDIAVMPGPSTNDAMAPLPGASDQYLIQPGDRLSVNVLGQDQLSGEFLVEADGSVNLPAIGPVLATGRSITDFQEGLVASYGTTVSDPQILVSVLNTNQ